MVEAGSVLWKDKNYKVQHIPPILDGSELEPLPYRLEPDVNLVINIDQVSTVYVAVHPESYSDSLDHWFQINDWSQVADKITFEGENVSDILGHIWSKEFLVDALINITSESAAVTIAVLIKPGLYFVR